MAIGSLGIKNMVVNGGILTISITVSLTILECFLRDPYSFSAFAGNLASDLMKIGIGSIFGAIAGLGAGGFTTITCAPIIATIGVSMFVGAGLNWADEHYELTPKLIATLEDMADNLNKIAKKAESSLYRGTKSFFRTQGLNIPNY